MEDIRAILVTNDRFLKVLTYDYDVHCYNTLDVDASWIQSRMKSFIVKYLGMGNKLLIRATDELWLDAKVKSHPDYLVKGEGVILFQNWQSFYTKE